VTQAERIKKAVGEFGASAKAKLNEGGQPEDQLRNPLEQLFAALARHRANVERNQNILLDIGIALCQ
jgi:hypothetical protein